MSWTPRATERKKGRLRGFMLTEETWGQSLKDHQKRMGAIRPTINFSKMPWGFDKDGTCAHKLSKKAPKPPSRPATAGRPQSGDAQQHSSARSQRGGAAQQSVATGRAALGREDFGIHSLTREQQDVCRAMQQLLVSLESSAQSKRIVEEVFVTAEESRLLRGYSGVFPEMEYPAENDEEDEEEQRKDNNAAGKSSKGAADAKEKSQKKDSDADGYEDNFESESDKGSPKRKKSQ